MRHIRLLVCGILASIVVAAAPAAAAVDLADHLRDADEAVYSGRRIIISVWAGASESAMLDIQHANGVTVVDRYGDDSVVGAGKLKSSGDGTIQFVDWTEDALSSRYTIRPGAPGTHAGRDTIVVEVLEGGVRRARFVFDQETHAPLVTEVYGGDGTLFRYSAMVEFAGGVEDMPLPGADRTAYNVAVPLAEHDFASVLGGYRLVDAYGGPDETTHGFYSDGLFSFSLFEIEGRADLGSMVDGVPLEFGGSEYASDLAPTELWVLWNAGDATYVLVGDLPPDHLEQVLADLPAPTRRNWFQRVWHNLFD